MSGDHLLKFFVIGFAATAMIAIPPRKAMAQSACRILFELENLSPQSRIEWTLKQFERRKTESQAAAEQNRERNSQNRRHQKAAKDILSIHDSELLLAELVDAIRISPSETPLRGLEDRLVEIGIDYRAVNEKFLRQAVTKAGLSGEKLVSFLSTLEYVVTRSNIMSSDDPWTMKMWVSGLIKPVAREFAEAVARPGFSLPNAHDRLGTSIEVASALYANLSKFYQALVEQLAPQLINDIYFLREILNLTETAGAVRTLGSNPLLHDRIMNNHEFQIRPLEANQENVRVFSLAMLLGVRRTTLANFYLSQTQRDSYVNDPTVNSGGPVIKSELLRAVVINMIRQNRLPFSIHDAQGI
jgi:hypothetical protein